MAGEKSIPEILLKKDVFVSSDYVRILETEVMRLDAPYYSDIFMQAKKVVERSPYPVVPLIELCDDIFRLNQFKRVWSDKKHGHPYMSATDLFYFKPLREQENPSRAYVARGQHGEYAKIKSAKKQDSIMHKKEGEERFFVEEGWILVSCSGSVGRLMLVTKSLSNIFFSHDFIRIVPKKETLAGYLYAYLNSRVGQAFLKRDKYGGWVKHIEPEQIKSIPVVLLPKNVQKKIHRKVILTYQHREDFLKGESFTVDKINSFLSS